MRSVSDWILLALVTLGLLLRAGMLARAPMEWGVMDDAAAVAQFRAGVTAPVGGGAGAMDGSPRVDAPPAGLAALPPLGAYFEDEMRGHLKWGLLRPVYPLWQYAVYGVLGTAWGWKPASVYLLCFLIYVAVGVGFARVFAAFLPRAAFPHGDPRIFFFLAYLAFTPGLNLITLISIQERLALVFLALSLTFLWAGRGGRPAGAAWDAAALAAYAAALGSKSTAVAYAPVLLGMIALRGTGRKRAGVIATAVGGLSLAWAAAAARVAADGTYTARYGAGPGGAWGALERYFLNGGAWAWIMFGLGATALISSLTPKLPARVRRPSLALWPLSAAALWMLMLPWGIHGYYWSLFTPLFAANLTLVTGQLAGRRFSVVVVFFVAAAAAVSMGSRLQRLVDRSVETGQAVRWLGSAEGRSAARRIWLAHPCEEPVRSLAILSGRPSEDFAVWGAGAMDSAPGPHVIATGWECPSLPTDVATLTRPSRDFGAWKFFELTPR